MAAKNSEKKKTAKPAGKKSKAKSKSKSKFVKYLLIAAILSLTGIVAYHYLHQQKRLPKPLKKAVRTIESLWTSDTAIQTPSPKSETDVKRIKRSEKTDEPKREKPAGTINKDQLKLFASGITPAVKEVLNLPYRRGADPKTDRATDNSHLIFHVWQQAALKANLSIGKYRPMQDLIGDCTEISLSDLNNGDLIVLKDGNAGLIYGFGEETDGFFLVYSSEKNRKVVSVPSQELKKYWLNPKNKKGYYRATKDIFN